MNWDFECVFLSRFFFSTSLLNLIKVYSQTFRTFHRHVTSKQITVLRFKPELSQKLLHLSLSTHNLREFMQGSFLCTCLYRIRNVSDSIKAKLLFLIILNRLKGIESMLSNGKFYCIGKILPFTNIALPLSIRHRFCNKYFNARTLSQLKIVAFFSLLLCSFEVAAIFQSLTISMDLIFLVVLKWNAAQNNQKVRCFNAGFLSLLLAIDTPKQYSHAIYDINRERKHFVGVFKKVSWHEKISSSKCFSTLQKETHLPHTFTLTQLYSFCSPAKFLF